MKATNNLDNLVLEYARYWLNSLNNYIIRIDKYQCYVAGGNNGPHNALETPVRNTAHVLEALRCIQKAGIRVDMDVIIGLEGWLLSCGFFKDGAYLARQSAGDHVNGVIGPAWVIQALVTTPTAIRYKELHQRSELLASKLTFDKRSRLWKRFDPFTHKESIDYTLDHQIWLAASLASAGFNTDIKAFMDGLLDNKNMYFRDNGRFHHIARDRTFKNTLLNYKYEHSGEHISDVENGYHMYHLFALALIYKYNGHHALFDTCNFHRSISYLEDNFDLIMDSTYGTSYNNPGLSFPLIYKIFGDYFSISEADVISRVKQSLRASSGLESDLIPWGNCDPVTSYSRYYELFLSLH